MLYEFYCKISFKILKKRVIIYSYFFKNLYLKIKLYIEINAKHTDSSHELICISKDMTKKINLDYLSKSSIIFNP